MASKEFTVHMIGNAHIDPIWLWRMQEGIDEVMSTCRTALQLMDEYPEFRFTRSSAITYKWIEQRDPEMFERIKARVREGRWDIVNGWIVQPDCNMPSGESFIRQALYGKRYFMDRFGVDVKVGYNVDSFGHCATLPQILKKCGLDYYVFFRPKPHEKTLPQVFWWESPDGSRVLACRPPHHYNSGPDEIEERIEEALAERVDGIADVMCFYGVGNHGGGPTRQNIESIRRSNANHSDASIEFSTPVRFFRSILQQKRSYPVIADELQYHSRGCYTAYSRIKRQNRWAENGLIAAERLSALALWLTGAPYPQQEINDAWEKLLFCQFHDILAGTSIKAAYDEDVDALYDAVFSTIERAISGSKSAIISKLDLPAGDNLVVMNLENWHRCEIVEIELPENDGSITVIDPHGVKVPSQRSSGKLLFIADIPSFGWTSYRLIRNPGVALAEHDTGLVVSKTELENEYFSLKISPHTGFIDSIFDKKNNIQLLSGPGNVPIVIDDRSDTWSHDVVSYKSEIGRFLIQGEPKIVETGPVRGSIRIQSAWGNSTIDSIVSLVDGIPAIDFMMTVDWHEKHRMLKIGFPINVEDPIATYEIPFGNISRPNDGSEQPHHSWVDVSGIATSLAGESFGYGVSLINDCKYGSDVDGNQIRLSVLRSPIYAFHDPAVPDPNKSYDYLDQGVQTVRYRLISHTGEWLARTVREGRNLNSALLVERIEGQKGVIKPFSLSVSPDNIICTALKKAEDDESLILRFYECAGRSGVATFTARVQNTPLAHLDVPFGRYEIKTLKLIRENGNITVAEVNMLEQG